jgi:hypothetical protein
VVVHVSVGTFKGLKGHAYRQLRTPLV